MVDKQQLAALIPSWVKEQTEKGTEEVVDLNAPEPVLSDPDFIPPTEEKEPRPHAIAVGKVETMVGRYFIGLSEAEPWRFDTLTDLGTKFHLFILDRDDIPWLIENLQNELNKDQP